MVQNLIISEEQKEGTQQVNWFGISCRRKGEVLPSSTQRKAPAAQMSERRTCRFFFALLCGLRGEEEAAWPCCEEASGRSVTNRKLLRNASSKSRENKENREEAGIFFRQKEI